MVEVGFRVQRLRVSLKGFRRGNIWIHRDI